MIRTTAHNIRKFTNVGKANILSLFMEEYRSAVKFYTDYFLNNEIKWNKKIFNVKKNQLDCPSMISTTGIVIETKLSARALKCASTQALGVVKAITEVQRKRLATQKLLSEKGLQNKKLDEQIEKWKLPTINFNNINAELNSICTDFQHALDGKFLGFIQLKSLGKSFGKIRIPVCHTKVYKKWSKQGKMLTSFLINENTVNLRFEIEAPTKKTEGIEVGADQGMKTCLTFSDGQITNKNNHGYDLDTICKILSRKKKGSKNFKETVRHRENYINWSINQLNLSKIKTVKLEEIINIGYKTKKSRFLSHFTNTLIRDKMKNVCEEKGVTFKLQKSAYRSQRCSKCGYVNKDNRKKKIFLCGKCAYANDADLNAALNHSQDLPDIPIEFIYLKKNIRGFYWIESGIFNLDGEELTVLHCKNK